MICIRLASNWEQPEQVLAGSRGVVVKPPTCAPPPMWTTSLVIADPSGFVPEMLILTSEVGDGDSILTTFCALPTERASKLYAFVLVGSDVAVNTSLRVPVSSMGDRA